ncbi:MAG: hypothetical protein WCJ29_01810 [bacterium]
MWVNRREMAREIAGRLKNHLGNDIEVRGVGRFGAAMEKEAREIMKASTASKQNVLLLIDSIEQISDVEPAIVDSRKQGFKRIILGVGVMPSTLVEPVKKISNELFVLLVPRFFRATGQYFAGVD